MAIVLFKMAVLRDAGVAYLPLGLAAAKALILGKFVLIGEAAHVGSRVGARTVLQRIVRRVVLLFALLIVLVVVEELLVGWFHGQPMAQTLVEYRHRLPEVLAMLLLLLLILVPLVAVTEVSHAMGPGALRDLFLALPGQASAGDVPAKSKGKARRESRDHRHRRLPVRLRRRACWYAARPGDAEEHLKGESKESIRTGIGLIATMTALVLGLVTASAKQSFDDVDKLVRNVAADVFTLDGVLARYGPDAAPLRANLKAVVESRVQATWPQGKAGNAAVAQGQDVSIVEQFASQVRALRPVTDEQVWLKSRATDLTESLMEVRFRVIGRIGSSVPVPYLIILVFWLTVTFASFGIFAPRNAAVVTVLLLCSLSAPPRSSWCSNSTAPSMDWSRSRPSL